MYKEFDTPTKDIVKLAVKMINTKSKDIDSDMPYKAQHLLEEVIKQLTELV